MAWWAWLGAHSVLKAHMALPGEDPEAAGGVPTLLGSGEINTRNPHPCDATAGASAAVPTAPSQPQSRKRAAI